MPTVPTIEQPRVQSKALTPQYSRLDTRGTHGEAIAEGVEHLGRGLANVASVAGDIYRKEREKQTTAAVSGAEAGFQTFINTTMDDAKAGFLNRRGENALRPGDGEPADKEPLQTLADRLESARQGFLEKLPTDEAKQAFNARSEVMKESARDRGMRHIGQQTEVVAQANLNAVVASSLDGLAGAYADPVTRAQLLEQPAEAIRKLSASAEDAAAKVADYRQKGHQVVLERFLLSGDVKGAKDYYAQVAGELGTAAGPVRKRLESESNALEGATEASRIFKDSLLDGSVWVDGAKAFGEADKLPEGPKKEEVIKNLREQVGRAEALKKQAGEAALNQLFSLQLQRGTTNTPEGRQVRSWMLDPANGASDLLYRFDKGLDSERRSNAYWDSQERRAQDDTDRLALSQFLARPIDAQAGTNVDAEFVGNASERARNQMKQYQNKARTSLEKNAGVGESEFSGFVSAEAARSGFGKDKQLTQQFKASMGVRRIQYLEEHAGKEPTRKDVRGWAAEETLYGDFGESAVGHALSRNRYQFQLSQEERGRFRPFGPGDQRNPANQTQPGQAPSEQAGPTQGQAAPPSSAPKVDKLTRARQLQRQGLAPAQIAATMTKEGY